MLKKSSIFFTCLFLYLIYVFRRAFTINFFQDDYFFLKISRIKNAGDFLRFFSPIREYSYKPLATEVFYFILHLFRENVFAGRLIVFVFYFIGLIFLYKIVKLLINDLTAKVTVFIYGASFIHVFQLYWFATFQEVAVFAFLCISFYLFLKNKHLLSAVFFILSLFCKETAALYAPFLVLYTLVFSKEKIKKLPIFIAAAFVFWLLYRYSLNFVTALDNYKMIWNPKLLVNNGIWYFLWGAGLSNFLPDYFRSIFSSPIATFWKILEIPYSKVYFFSLALYLILFGLCLIYYIFTKKRNNKWLLIYLFFNFFVFLGPILFFIHKWMIRLTEPLIFIALIEGLVIYQMLANKNKVFKYTGVILLILYGVWNFFGVAVHEISSTYVFENNVYLKTKSYFVKNKPEILKHDVIYLKDTTHNLPKGWNGSEKLINSFAEGSFIDHFVPEKRMKVIFGFQDKNIPEDAYVINSNDLLP